MSPGPSPQPSTPRLVVASANPDKVAEIAAIMAAAGVDLVPRPQELGEVVEDAPTLEGNVRLKAVAVQQAAGAPALADDTGLEVEALGLEPGVRSARYAGERATYRDNVDHLLSELERVGAVDADRRRARFRTVAMVSYPDGTEVMAEGVVEGHIALEPVGDGGFGYDPVFVPDGAGGRTFAQMPPDEKNAMSHRGRAFRALAELLAREG